MFGLSSLLDHPCVVFDLVEGGTLSLPCGTVPTAMVEKGDMQEDGSTGYRTLLTIAVPSQTLSWEVRHRAEEVQDRLREGLMRLNQESPGPEPLPFRP
tara:strand:- start:667 stop:960 length:294 start_codon:yes stop_codon:yes gene_type:complete